MNKSITSELASFITSMPARIILCLIVGLIPAICSAQWTEPTSGFQYSPSIPPGFEISNCGPIYCEAYAPMDLDGGMSIIVDNPNPWTALGDSPAVALGSVFDGPVAAPEIDPAGAIAALTLLLGGLAVLRGKRAHT